jgi:sec-independent protein translocase protein TatA
MFGLGTFELVLILVIVFTIFGAGKLPKLMKDLGKGFKSFKLALNDVDGEYENVTPKNRETQA